MSLFPEQEPTDQAKAVGILFGVALVLTLLLVAGMVLYSNL